MDIHMAGRSFYALKTTFMPSVACLTALQAASGNCVTMNVLLVPHLAYQDSETSVQSAACLLGSHVRLRLGLTS